MPKKHLSRAALILFGVLLGLLPLAVLELTLRPKPATGWFVKNHYYKPKRPDDALTLRVKGAVRASGLRCDAKPSPADRQRLDEGFWDEIDFSHGAPYEALLSPSGKAGTFRTWQRTKSQGVTIFEATVGINEHGQRVVPGFRSNGQSQLLFVGDSYTFGQGVEDGEAFPSLVQEALPRHSVYNLGLPGFAPHDMLFELERKPRRYAGIPKKKGLAFYVFIPNHMDRVFVPLRMLVREPTRDQRPGYERSAIGEVEYHGPIEGRPYHGFYELAAQSKIVRQLHLNWPLFYRERDYDLFAGLVKKFRDEARGRFGVDDLVTVIFPLEGPANRPVAEALRRAGLPVLDLGGLDLDIATGGNALYADEHPTACSHFALAQLILEEIKRRETESGAP